jgi:hypothetical protein
MKKFDVLFIAMIIMALVIGCKSVPANVPEWINDLPPAGMLWGIGYAKLQNEGLSRDAAMSRARRDIAAQLGVLVQSMLTDYARESGTLNDTASIQSIERVTQEIININFSGAAPNEQRRMSDGTWWVRVALSKIDASKMVNDVFVTEASRYADFNAKEAAGMMSKRINETQSRPTPRSSD